MANDIVAPFKVAREKMWHYMAGIEHPNIRLTWDQMDKKHSALLDLDPTFVIELSLFQALAEGKTAELLGIRVLAALLSAESMLSPDDTFATLDSLLNSDSVKVFPEIAVGKCNTIKDMVADIRASKKP